VDRSESSLSVVYTTRARLDFLDIWVYNLKTYNREHADAYSAFLMEEFDRIGERIVFSKPVEGFPGMRCLTVKRRSAGHGHAAYFRVHDDDITIMRILHTAMQAPDHLEGR
jgi:plasmid stabilization system protein ParE